MQAATDKQVGVGGRARNSLSPTSINLDPSTMPTTSNWSFSTILSWLFYFVPIYVFLLAPGYRALFPSTEQQEDTARNLLQFGDNYEDYDNLLPGLNVTDDSFISPEEGLDATGQPLNCRDDDYRVHIFSHTPLIIYIEDFFTGVEADHLVAVRFVYSTTK